MNKRKFLIKDRVLTKDDLLRLWELVKNKAKQKEGENPENLKITISCFDDTVYTSNQSHFFDNGEILDLKKCQSVNIFYKHSMDEYLGIDITLEECNQGKVMVESEDHALILEIISQIETIVNSAKPQPRTYLHVLFGNWLGIILTSVTLGYLTLWFFYFLSSFRFLGKAIFPEPSWTMGFSDSWLTTLLTIIALPMVVGLLLIAVIVSYFDKLWPTIEFDFGPEHTKVQKKRRKILVIAISTIILPILINLFF